MNRNSKSHFSATDNQINMGRSTFNRDSWFKTTFNFGDLIPFYLDEVLPGDTFDMKTSLVCRMATPKVPVMDNAYLDTYYFFVPARLLWDKWEEFNGQADPNAWEDPLELEIPQGRVYLSDGAKNYNFTLVDYFGLPVMTPDRWQSAESGYNVNLLPFRAYYLIYNEWFRDQNLQDAVLIDKATPSGSVTGLDPRNGGIIPSFQRCDVLRVNRFHDYFSSALPAPQKGSAVQIPGLSDIPVVAGSPHNRDSQALAFQYDQNLNNQVFDLVASGYGYGGRAYLNESETVSATSDALVKAIPSNLYTSQPFAGMASIDSLRLAFQIQKLLWRDGNGGSRYTELLRSHFGVVSPDSRLQRPEYLGGKRIPLTMNQVLQQSATVTEGNDASPLGNTGAFSKTVDSFNGFQKSFTEHGYIIGVCCARTDHTYQNGINKLWSRRDRFDFYYPELAHIGEQPILKKELFVNSAETILGEPVWGYQEAWAEYRYRPSYVTGSFRSNVPQGSLDAWHYADDYDSEPFLSAGWMQEPFENVNRSLAVSGTSDRHEQLIADFYFNLKTTRPMPVYSVPGLVDHF